MNPGAATFTGPGMGGMMYMPGGTNYFTPPGYSQVSHKAARRAPWGRCIARRPCSDHSAAAMHASAVPMRMPSMHNPGWRAQQCARLTLQAWQGAQYGQYGMTPSAMQAGAGGQQGMATSGAMAAPPQSQPASAPYATAAAGTPKPVPVATPPREKKILRLENPETHEVIDLSKPMASGEQAGGSTKAADKKKVAAPAAKSVAVAEAKKPEAATGAPQTAAEAVKGTGPSKAAAEAAAAAALKPKEAVAPAAAVPEAATPTAAVPEAATPAAAGNLAAAPVAPTTAGPTAAAPVAAAAAAPKPAAVWGSGQSFKEKLMVDPAEKKRQEEEAARKKAADDEVARKKLAEEEAARKLAEDTKRKVTHCRVRYGCSHGCSAMKQWLCFLVIARYCLLLFASATAVPGICQPMTHSCCLLHFLLAG